MMEPVVLLGLLLMVLGCGLFLGEAHGYYRGYKDGSSENAVEEKRRIARALGRENA